MTPKLRPIYYDVETTGVKAEEDRIIEIAAFDPLHDKSFVELVNPGVAIPLESVEIHSITDEMVKEAPSFAEVGKRFLDFCQGEVVLIAHNNDAFDKIFLTVECKRHQLSLPPYPFLDSLKWSRKYRPDLPRHSLQHLREVFQIPPNQAHRALDDVMVLYQIFSRLIDDLDMETALKLLAQEKSLLRTMPFGKHRGKPLTEVPSSYLAWLQKNEVLEKPENELLKKSLEKLNLLK